MSTDGPTRTLFALDGDYEWDADVMRCRHCKQTQQVFWRKHPFQHGQFCAARDPEDRPWLVLTTAIGLAAAKDASR